ncbi:LuxR C-terminal-related transcriptional regulator [Microbacterium sp. M28]|uniref:response regulator transcription factor n=1 Tax=Microbacterium sp. M28 TaxID=2962064 RepID=UPI0021F4738F|nr:LuxR C-terminal-related transcriptional regulator [Microbacterium sp. M28]UYO97676.1 LuxR C-terminal-related transcriptional regulator [Microbacterium sp. M28]
MLIRHVREASSGAHDAAALEPLTDRETEVLDRLAAGMSNAEIAQALIVSEGTVKAHLGRIMSKWHVRDRVQILVTAARAGLIDFR